MRIALATVMVALVFALAFSAPETEAPVGFDNRSNGTVDDATHQTDQGKFEEVEAIKDGLGPLYNAQSCRECHQDPVSGSASQVTELRVGHLDPKGHFQNPEIPMAHGSEIIKGRSLVNDRAICPNGQFPDTEIHERVPDSEQVRTTRVSVNLLGDGFVEAVADQTLVDLAREQCKKSHREICGLALRVPIVEAPGETGIGRFGWKDQQASLLSFSGDAYLNEMGITNRLFPDEVTNRCNAVSEPNDTSGADGLADIDHFARFLRATKAPAPDKTQSATPAARRGSELFHKIGCEACHVPTLSTASAGTKIDGGTFTIPAALGQKTFHAYSDFLLHDVGTGDGIVMAVEEHYGRNVNRVQWKGLSTADFGSTQNRIRTAPLWGVRLRTRLMHDGTSVTLSDAIGRHRGEAQKVEHRFEKLSAGDRDAVVEFLKSL
jgi:CxxC motif-containing protein (DUF1111 family)